MKTKIIALIIVSGLLLVTGSAIAGNSQLEHYYNDYITQKIYNCCKTASLFKECQNASMKELAEMRAAQAIFYEQNRADLIKGMLSHDVSIEAYRIDYFLITQFKNGKRQKFVEMD